MTAELTIAKSLRALGIKAMKSASQVLSKGPVHLEMLVRTNLFHLSAAEQLKNYTMECSCWHGLIITAEETRLGDSFPDSLLVSLHVAICHAYHSEVCLAVL